MISDWIAIQTYINSRSKGKASKSLEKVIALNGEAAYLYALKVLNGRFQKGEKSIALNPEISVKYARFVLRSRFKEAEKLISFNPELCYQYFKHVVRERLPEKMHVSMLVMSFKFPGNYFIAKYMKEVGVLS
ncbi:hypothetical protein EBT16_01400 [bacterium]|nr:hypothetical protein [bacterium]